MLIIHSVFFAFVAWCAHILMSSCTKPELRVRRKRIKVSEKNGQKSVLSSMLSDLLLGEGSCIFCSLGSLRRANGTGLELLVVRALCRCLCEAGSGPAGCQVNAGTAGQGSSPQLELPTGD